jgi:signal transduction histidine kinase
MVAAKVNSLVAGMRQRSWYLPRLLLVGLAYWVAARLSLNLALVHGQVTPIWPPTGIALVAILVFGRGVWPAILLAALAVNLPLGPSPSGAAVIAAGNTIAPLVSAGLLARVGFQRELDRMRDAVAIIVLGALVGMTISATVGSSVLTLSGAVPAGNFVATWAVWWTGDAMGVLLVAPFLLNLLSRSRQRPLGWRGRAELTILLAVVGVVTYVLFQNVFRVEYLVLPLIMVAAWRFRLRGAAPAALIASVVAIWAAVNGNGPFASETLLQKMVTLQAFNVSVSLASFVFASFVDAREQKEEMTRLYESASLAITAKTDAIDVAAHELSAPLAILTSYLALLSDGKLGPAPDKWTSVLNVMADKAWQVNRIVTDLLDAARIEAKAIAPSRTSLDLREVVLKAVEKARPRAELSGGEIVAILDREPVQVEADARQVGRILDNLINNALTYGVRQPRLKISVVTDADRAVVQVIDNGVGMSKTERIRVFQPFQRSNDPVFDSVPGSGLGLFVSRQLAEANKGVLTLERSEPGLGTCFELSLPVAKATPTSLSSPGASSRTIH